MISTQLMTDIVGHIGYLFTAVGLVLLRQKNKKGWIVRLIGEVIWTLLGVYMQMSSIWLWGLIFIVVDLSGYEEWRRKEEWHDF